MFCNNLYAKCSRDEFNDSKETKKNATEEINPSTTEITKLKFPRNFKFKTYNNIIITIYDNATYAHYEVYAYVDEQLDYDDLSTKSEFFRHLLFTGTPTNGSLKHTIAVPSIYT
ncbi:MAG: hypothetical protein V3U92_06360 [Cellulophaga sp.]